MNLIRLSILSLFISFFSFKAIADYTAVLSCEFSGSHTNIYVCFMGDYTETELELKNFGNLNIYKAYDLQSLGYETSEGFEFTLSDSFYLVAQNASDTMVLRLKIYDTNYNVVYEDVAGHYDVISVQN
tara:strand:+ start:31 stop:414 length:384 start_codon:yes stop_codon:yes gene_type:complete